MELFFDTETSGLPLTTQPLDHPDQPHVIQLGWVLSDAAKVYSEGCVLILPDREDFTIHPKAEEVHGISKALLLQTAVSERVAAAMFWNLLQRTETLIAHNIKFDLFLMQVLLTRVGIPLSCFDVKHYCTMMGGTPVCQLPGKYGKYKWPKLMELHKHLFDEEFDGAHDALEDVRATRRCFYAMNGGQS